MSLEDKAESVIAEAIKDTLDMTALREDARGRVFTAAENATIYYGDCMEIVRRYETEAWAEAEEYGYGKTYEASEWRQAVNDYAFALARVVIGRAVEASLNEIEEAADALAEAAAAYGLEDVGAPRVTGDCPHGWAAHDREDENDIHYWSEPNLEGCRAVAVPVAGVWLSYTWTPEPAEEAAAEG
jgi:hypothetical protein